MSGEVETGTQLDMASVVGEIWYTLDGSDPRLPGGAVNPNAIRYGSSVSLLQNADAKARVFQDDQWSALRQATFTVVSPPRVANIRADLAGDVDGNGQVDVVDLAIIQANVGNESETTRAQGDLDGDGKVTRRDFVFFLQNLEGGRLEIMTMWPGRSNRPVAEPAPLRLSVPGEPLPIGHDASAEEIDGALALLDL